MRRAPLAPILLLLPLLGCPPDPPPCEGDDCGGGDPSVEIVSFVADPAGVALGETTTLTWATRNANACEIAPDIGASIGTVPRSGSLVIEPRLSTTWTLTCEGVGGPVTADASVSLTGVVDAGFDAGFDAGPPTSCAPYAALADGVYLLGPAPPRAPDAGVPPPFDGGPDAGSSDAGDDGGSLDGGSLDAGDLDAGAIDAGYDAGPPDLGPPYFAYCLNSVAGGGWTLAAKVDGTTSTLSYDDPLWTNDTLLVPSGEGLVGGDAKLRAATTVPFDEVLIGLRPFVVVDGGTVDAGTNWLTLNISAGSLTRLFAGPYAPSDAGLEAWKAMLPDGNLQPNCHREGANVEYEGMPSSGLTARFGILGNEQNDCLTPDSYIGVGTGVAGSAGLFDAWSAGGEWRFFADDGGTPEGSVPAQAFVLVR